MVRKNERGRRGQDEQFSSRARAPELVVFPFELQNIRLVPNMCGNSSSSFLPALFLSFRGAVAPSVCQPVPLFPLFCRTPQLSSGIYSAIRSEVAKRLLSLIPVAAIVLFTSNAAGVGSHQGRCILKHWKVVTCHYCTKGLCWRDIQLTASSASSEKIVASHHFGICTHNSRATGTPWVTQTRRLYEKRDRNRGLRGELRREGRARVA